MAGTRTIDGRIDLYDSHALSEQLHGWIDEEGVVAAAVLQKARL